MPPATFAGPSNENGLGSLTRVGCFTTVHEGDPGGDMARTTTTFVGCPLPLCNLGESMTAVGERRGAAAAGRGEASGAAKGPADTAAALSGAGTGRPASLGG